MPKKIGQIDYGNMNSFQKKIYRFQLVSNVLTENGYKCIWLNNERKGADFVALHIDENSLLKVKIKGRLTCNKKYSGKDIYIAFHDDTRWWIYPHDQMRDELYEKGLLTSSKTWNAKGYYRCQTIPVILKFHMSIPMKINIIFGRGGSRILSRQCFVDNNCDLSKL